jgi:hypothetical protein
MSLSSWLGATLVLVIWFLSIHSKKHLSLSLSICSWIWATIVLVIWLLGKAPKMQLSLKLSILFGFEQQTLGSCDVVASRSTLYLSLSLILKLSISLC